MAHPPIGMLIVLGLTAIVFGALGYKVIRDTLDKRKQTRAWKAQHDATQQQIERAGAIVNEAERQLHQAISEVNDQKAIKALEEILARVEKHTTKPKFKN